MPELLLVFPAFSAEQGAPAGASIRKRREETYRHSERKGERESETQVCRPTRDV